MSTNQLLYNVFIKYKYNVLNHARIYFTKAKPLFNGVGLTIIMNSGRTIGINALFIY